MQWLGRLVTLALVGMVACGCTGASPRPPLPTDPLAGITPASPTSTRSQMPDPRDNLLHLDDNGKPRVARIVAVVNTQAILEDEVFAAAFHQLAGITTQAEKDKLIKEKLNEIIERELVIQDAEFRLGDKANGKFLNELWQAAGKEFEKQWLHKLMRANGYTDPAKFTQFMKDNGVAVDQVRRQWERNFVAMEYARGRLEGSINRISHSEVLDYYRNNPDQFKVEEAVEWQDLFIAAASHPSREAARQFAESLVARARRGEDFTKLSKQFDNGDAGLRPNSEGIGKKKGEIRPVEAEPSVLALKEGEVGGPIEMETGYHIVRVMKRTEAGLRPLDGPLQRMIREKLRGDTFVKEMKHWVSSLRRRAVIQTVDP